MGLRRRQWGVVDRLGQIDLSEACAGPASAEEVARFLVRGEVGIKTLRIRCQIEPDLLFSESEVVSKLKRGRVGTPLLWWEREALDAECT